MRYILGIPTFNRDDMLLKTLEAIRASTFPPELILVVNNNDRPLSFRHDLFPDVWICRNAFKTPGPEQGHQTVLTWASAFNYDVAVRWDDDLVPEPDCLGRLTARVDQGYCSACGGMYPRPGDDKYSSVNGAGDGFNGHLQFFTWKGEHRFILRRHLYSSFAYDVKIALRAGGFCPMYSRYGFRGETDFTMRLSRRGGHLGVDTAAIAHHHWAAGGTRAYTQAEADGLSKLDHELFIKRMTEYGIRVTE